MDYISWHLKCNPVLKVRELLYPVLSDFGFDSFEETPEGLKAYIPKNQYQEGFTEQIFKDYPYLQKDQIAIEVAEIVHQNWNALWESNFEAIYVGKELCIRAPFHEKSDCKLDLLIEPQMSFGTGHHETTYLMCSYLLAQNLQDKLLLDVGSGTGILTILGDLLGASKNVGVEIETHAVENAKHNAQLNKVTRSTFILGDANAIPQENYDVVLANINRNVLLEDLPKYASVLKNGGSLFLSGFYTSDIPLLQSKAEELNLTLTDSNAKNDWCALHFQK